MAAMDELDFEPEEDAAPAARSRGKRGGMKSKGRGHNASMGVEDQGGRGGVFESVDGSEAGPIKSVEGWILFVRGVHEEAQEDDILDKFSEFGDVRNINVNLDRHTGFVKGYALVEFNEYDEAAEALEKMNGADILGQTISVDWAFIKTDKRR
mmetsp:Transcript_48372/g.109901  ORF Transcript_48372/g.109901 Transcript_48372/m.109901 type:complete len:153 (+) Transcript_48372:49-507(+)